MAGGETKNKNSDDRKSGRWVKVLPLWYLIKVILALKTLMIIWINYTLVRI